MSLFSEKYGKFAEGLVKSFGLHTAGFTGYFLLGYFLNRNAISYRNKHVIYVAGIAGFVVGMIMSVCVSIMRGEGDQFFYDNMTLNTMCMSVAVFVFFKAKFNYPLRIIRALSDYSFGAYLVHVAVIYTLKWLGLNTLTFNPVFSVPVISIIVFIFSFAISAILNHIPVLNKYIV